jgi:hypothetical protein
VFDQAEPRKTFPRIPTNEKQSIHHTQVSQPIAHTHNTAFLFVFYIPSFSFVVTFSYCHNVLPLLNVTISPITRALIGRVSGQAICGRHALRQ